MNMVGHHDVTRATAFVIQQFPGEQLKQCIPQRLAIEQSTSVVARERDELSVLFGIVDLATRHAAILVPGRTCINLLGFAHRQSAEEVVEIGRDYSGRLSVLPVAVENLGERIQSAVGVTGTAHSHANTQFRASFFAGKWATAMVLYICTGVPRALCATRAGL